MRKCEQCKWRARELVNMRITVQNRTHPEFIIQMITFPLVMIVHLDTTIHFAVFYSFHLSFIFIALLLLLLLLERTTNMSNYVLQFDLCIYYFVLIFTSFHYVGCSRTTRIRQQQQQQQKCRENDFWSPQFFIRSVHCRQFESNYLSNGGNNRTAAAAAMVVW